MKMVDKPKLLEHLSSLHGYSPITILALNEKGLQQFSGFCVVYIAGESLQLYTNIINNPSLIYDFDTDLEKVLADD